MTDNFVHRSNILHRNLQRRPEKVVSGMGIRIQSDSGRLILDACSGPSVSCLGHHQPDVANAITRQLNNIAYVYSGSCFTCDPTEELASRLLARRPGGLSKAIFVNSGSEATDAALKLVSQYWHEIGKPEKTHFIARSQSYHGNTLGALSVSGHDSRRALYECWMSNNVSFVDPCYAYRAKSEGESDSAYVERLSAQLEAEILRIGSHKVAGFIAETVSGTSLGCVPPVPGYFKAVRKICDKYDVLLILDEIMCGMGKTGTMHAWEQEDIRGPDVQTIGKALGAGFVPLSGVLLHHKIYTAIARGSKGLMHGHTFQAHPTACAGAVAVQEIIEREDLLENVRRKGDELGALLHSNLTNLPFVADVRGRGLFWGVEFMRDSTCKMPFRIDEGFSSCVVQKALENGLNILGNLGVTGKYYVDHVIIAPPYIVTSSELEEIVGILRKTIIQVSRQYQRDSLCSL